MNIKEIRCPNCGGTLNIEDGKEIQFCNYCGNKIAIEDKNKTVTHNIIDENRNIKIDKNENYTHHYVDEAKIQEINAKKEESNQKRKTNIILLISWIASLLLFLVVSFFTMDSVNFSPFHVLIIIDIIVGIGVIRWRSKK